MDENNLTEHFLTITRMFSDIKAELNHMASKSYVLKEQQNHAANCSAAKKYRWLSPIATILAGLGFLGGLIISQLM